MQRTIDAELAEIAEQDSPPAFRLNHEDTKHTKTYLNSSS
jgi:hypothetical protein